MRINVSSCFVLFFLMLQPSVIALNNHQENPDILFDKASNFYEKEQNYAQAKQLWLKSAKMYLSQGDKKKSILARYNAYRASTANMESLDQAQHILFDALKIVDTSVEYSREVAVLYSGLQLIYTRLYQYENALYYGDKSLKAFDKIGVKDSEVYYLDVLIYRIINNIDLYNYDLAKTQAGQALSFAKKHNLEESHVYPHLFRIYRYQNNYDAINEILENPEILSMIDSSPLFIYFDIYGDIMATYREAGQYKKALNSQRKLANRIAKSPYKVHFSQRYLAMGFAHIYFDMGEYEKSINILKDHDDEKTRELKPKEASMCDLQIGESYLKLKNYKLAKLYIDKALSYNTQEFNDDNIVNNFSTIDAQLLEKLFFKAELFNALSKTSDKDLYQNKELKIYEVMHQVLVELGRSSIEDNHIIEENYELLYNNLLELLWKKWKKSNVDTVFYKAFSISDESRLVAVMNEVKAIQQVKQFYNSIPKQILEKEISLKSQWDSINRVFQISKAEDVKKNKEEIRILFKNFKEQLANDHPKYYQFKYGIDKSLEKKLKEDYKNWNVIEFFWGTEAIFIFKKFRNELVFDRIPLTKELSTSIDNFIVDVKTVENENYKQTGAHIYNSILKPYLVKNERTVVVLDDKLHQLPLEALWVNDTEGGHFLVKDISVLRLNAFKQEIILPNKKEKVSQNLLFAPFGSKGDSVNTALPSSFDEVNYIASLFESDVFIGEKASKSNFLEATKNQPIIHLATHSKINSDDALKSKIYFYNNEESIPSDGFITSKELYGLHLNANLVTLSSCETGIGKEVKGKGVLSLSNAFAFAGVSSTIMSLWKIPDNETSQVMKNFYKNLENGESKDKALRSAKTNYLKSQKDAISKHPYYWAGFVISGDASPLNHSNLINLWLILGALALVLIITLVLVTKKKAA